MTLRRIGKNVGLVSSHPTISRIIDEYALNSKSPLEVSMELRPKWGAFLQIDAASIKVKDRHKAENTQAMTNALETNQHQLVNSISSHGRRRIVVAPRERSRLIVFCVST